MKTTSDSPFNVPPRLDAAAVVFAALLPTAVTAVYFIGLSEQPTWVQQAAWAVGKLVQFTFPVAWVLAVQQSRPRMGRQWRAGLGAGAASGMLVLAAMLLVYHAWLGPAGTFDEPALAMREKLVGMGLDSPARYLAFAAFLSVVHSLLEEYYYRWFVFGQMRRRLPLWPSIILSSLAFAAHHVLVLAQFFGWASALTWLGVAAVAAGGAYWAWLYERTGSLLGPWISHLLVDVAILAVGYELLLA